MASISMGVSAHEAGANDEAQALPIVEKPDYKPEGRQYGIDALFAFGRVTDPQVSPDGKKILYGVSYESVEHNRSNRDLYVMNIDGSNPTRLTRTATSENNAVWIDGGARIVFMWAKDKDAKPQMWVMNADGSNPRQVSDIEKGIEGFVISPDGKKVVLISTVKYARTAADVYPDLAESTGRIIDDLMYKHWDEWATEIPHPFIADFDGQTLSNIKDILGDEPFEAPMRPWGGVESFAFSPDSQKLIYVSRKKTGIDYTLSTNSDLYLYDIATGETENLTEGMEGYDTCPAFSPDGKYVAWLSMEHDGYESDKNRIFIHELATGKKTDLTEDWDYAADAIAWAPDSKSVLFLAPYQGGIPIFSVNIKNRKVTTVAEGECDYAAVVPVDNKTVLTLRHSMLYPNEICAVNIKDGQVTQLSHVNDELLASVDMPTVEKHWVTTTDGKQMLTWVLLPPNIDRTKQYPALLYCQGGPQSPVSQFWSYRWNLALMAAQGYVVIAPNRRGLPGFGTEWNAQISGDYGGQNMQDYLSAVDQIKQEPYVDSKHIGALGASYGGFSVYWLAGHHEGRFACFVAHAGIFNTEAQYLETEEMWFANWDLGGPYWETNNPVAKRSFENSPHRFVDKWDTPILVTHGEYDFRILASQGMMAFNAAKLRGIPAEMLIFPDENHWILKPQNSALWLRVLFRWTDKWLKVNG